jgi:hypothetical protein
MLMVTLWRLQSSRMVEGKDEKEMAVKMPL